MSAIDWLPFHRFKVIQTAGRNWKSTGPLNYNFYIFATFTDGYLGRIESNPHRNCTNTFSSSSSIKRDQNRFSKHPKWATFRPPKARPRDSHNTKVTCLGGMPLSRPTIMKSAEVEFNTDISARNNSPSWLMLKALQKERKMSILSINAI